MNDLSGYPPGVTGVEDQIAGPRHELVLHRACDREAVEWHSAEIVRQMMTAYMHFARDAVMRSHELTLGDEAYRLRSIWTQRLAEHSAEFACDWEGDAEVAVWSDGTGTWECPRCGTDHEFDYGGEQDDAVQEQREERTRDRGFE